MGRKIGFPTININYGNQLFPKDNQGGESRYILPFGVYTAKVYTSSGVYKGALHFGPRRVLDPLMQLQPALEVHILDFSADLYGHEVKVEIFEKIRDTQDFPDFESLKKQIGRDVEAVRQSME